MKLFSLLTYLITGPRLYIEPMTLLSGGSLALSAFGMFKSDKAGKRQAAAIKASAIGQSKIKYRQANMMLDGAEFDKTTAGYNLRMMQINQLWDDYQLEHDLQQLENTRKGLSTELSAAIAETREQAKRSTAELAVRLAKMGGDLLSVSTQSAFIDSGIQSSKVEAQLRYDGWNKQSEIIAQRGVMKLQAEYNKKRNSLNQAVSFRESEQNYKTAVEQAGLVKKEADLIKKTGVSSSQVQTSINRAQSLSNFGSLAMQGFQAYNSFKPTPLSAFGGGAPPAPAPVYYGPGGGP